MGPSGEDEASTSQWSKAPITEIAVPNDTTDWVNDDLTCQVADDCQTLVSNQESAYVIQNNTVRSQEDDQARFEAEAEDLGVILHAAIDEGPSEMEDEDEIIRTSGAIIHNRSQSMNLEPIQSMEGKRRASHSSSEDDEEDEDDEASADNSATIVSATMSEREWEQRKGFKKDAFDKYGESLAQMFKGLDDVSDKVAEIPNQVAELSAEIAKRVQYELDMRSQTNTLAVSSNFVASWINEFEFDTLSVDLSLAAEAMQNMKTPKSKTSVHEYARLAKKQVAKEQEAAQKYLQGEDEEDLDPERALALMELADTQSLSDSSADGGSLSMQSLRSSTRKASNNKRGTNYRTEASKMVVDEMD